MTAPQRRRRGLVAGRVQAALPGIVGGLAFAVLVCAIVVVSVEAPRSSIAGRLYSAVELFAGAYLPQPGQSSPPSPLMSAVGVAALVVTFTAAITALLALTTRAREWLRARRAGSELIVIGSGRAAAEILRSHPGAAPAGLLLVTGDRRGAAAVAARGHAASTVVDLESLAGEGGLVGLRSRGGTIAVATDDDALNIDIAEGLTREPVPGARKVMAIVEHPLLAEELRPPLIRGRLAAPYGISCPIENIAEQICHHLDELLAGDEAVRAAGHATVVVDGDGGAAAAVVETWVRRFTWSRSFLRGAVDRPVPLLRMSDEPEAASGGPVIRIAVGDDQSDTAARTLRAMRRDQGEEVRHIAVTSPRLLRPGPGDRVAVVDPRAAAWDQRLVFDDIAEQWGRLYHSVYGVLWNSFTPWAAVYERREGQSSVSAGLFMLCILEAHGFHLVKTDERPVDPGFTPEEVTSMAAAEHEEWWERRTYDDGTGRRAKVSDTSTNPEFRMPWDELGEKARQQNENLTRCTIPALAALFGYEVRRVRVAATADVTAPVE